MITVTIVGKSFNFLSGTIDSQNWKYGQDRYPTENWNTIKVENKIPLYDPRDQIHTNFIDQPKNVGTIVKFGMSKFGKEFLPYF